MRITIVAVGKLKEPYWRDAAAEYLKRLGPYATLNVIEVADRDLARGEEQARATEGDDLLRALPGGAHVVALDAAGRSVTSEAFADWIGACGLDGKSHLAFVIGGSAGFAPEVLGRADDRISLGAMTFPHQLARVVLLEQVYRGFRILRGEPYHR